MMLSPPSLRSRATLLMLCLAAFVSCRGPAPVEPINSRMTEERHTAEMFPIDHGATENASKECAPCHGGLPTFSEFKCTSCHAHEQPGTDTLHSLVATYSYDSKNCLSCHPRGDILSRENHAEYFPIHTGDVHEAAACADCHTDLSTAGYGSTTAYERYSCIDCHEHSQAASDPVHAGVSDYVYASSSCLSCHPNGTAMSRDQHTYFPINTDTAHETIACSQCHTTSSYKDYTCIDCHDHLQSSMDPAHVGVANYVYASSNCFSCHPDGTAMTREDHTYFPITASTSHEKAECSQCHTGTSYKSFTCIDCHEHAQSAMDPDHVGVANYVYASSSCYACHPDGTAMSRDDHTDFPIASGSKHADAECSQCHTGPSYTDFSCVDCHEHAQGTTDPAHTGVANYIYASSSCYTCHPDGTAMTREDHTDFPITAGTLHETAQCSQCHTTSSYQQFSCLDCHEHARSTLDTAHNGVMNYVYASPDCYSCHPDGTGASRDEHLDFPIATGSVHADAACSQCHTGPTYDQYSCLECHEHAQPTMDPAHTGVNDYKFDSESCLTCHPNGTAITRDEHTDFPVDAGSVHAAAACNQCHTTSDYKQFTCVECHEHAQPVTDPAHTGVNDYAFDSNSCLSCHPNGTAISRPEHTDFPIDTGAVHQDAACNQCHTTSDYKQFTCVECHEHAQPVADPAHVGVNDYAFDSSSCFSCHPDGTALTRPEHTYFPIDTGSSHQDTACNQCHATSDYTQFTCVSCHTHDQAVMDPDHTGVTNYVYASSSCLACHPAGTAVTRDEHASFPIDTGTVHQEAACNQCHNGPTYDQFTCVTCHEHAQPTTDSDHAGVNDYLYASSNCLACHPDGTAMNRTDHLYFPIANGSVHQEAACNQCHTTSSYAQFSCVACHEHAQSTTDSDHVGVASYVYASSNCLSCHPDGTAVTRAEHLDFPIDTGTTHVDATCSQCHTGSSYSQYSCVECHEHAKTTTDPEHLGVVGYIYASSSCLSCHPDGTAMSRSEHTNFPIDAGAVHYSAACIQCHTTSDYSQFSCLDCHEHAKSGMDTEHATVAGYVYASSNCLSCHPTGTAMSRDEHTEFPITTGTVHEDAACSDCHTGSTPAEFSCVSCHEHAKTSMDPDHTGVANYVYASSNCLACHPDGQALHREDHSYFPIDPASKHAAAECADCHTTPSHYQDFTCITCHEHAQNTMDADHVGVSNYVYASSSCVACHPDGQAISRDSHIYFPINPGTAHQDAACEQCHTTGQYQAFSCIDCHEHAKSATDADHAAVASYVYASSNCLACHPNGQAVSRQDHTYFPIDTGSKHEDAACSDCHTGSSNTEFTCLSCHEHNKSTTNTEHSDVMGYLYASSSCLSCHPTGMAVTRDQHTWFPIDVKSNHADPECIDCHTVGSYQAFTCIDCHEHAQTTTDTEHANVMGYVYASSNCYSCHPDGLALSPEEHDPYFPIKTGTNHEGSECAACHTTGTYQAFSCIDCHEHARTTMDSDHAAVWGYVYATTNCYGCHPDGNAITPTEHSSLYFPITSGAHSGYKCQDCHMDPTTYSVFTCIGCHNGTHQCSTMNPKHSGVKNYQCLDSACYSCHPNGKN